MTKSVAAKNDSAELLGSVLDVARALLENHASTPAVLDVVAKLVSRNEELEKFIARSRASYGGNERVAKEQLDLCIDKLRKEPESILSSANAALEKVAAENGGREEPAPPPQQPPVRRPPPPGLGRIEHPITVPPRDRACPVCGAERTCITHEATEVIDFKSAEVFVRRDIREILACDVCEAELVHARWGTRS